LNDERERQRVERWQMERLRFDITHYPQLLSIIEAVREVERFDDAVLGDILRRYPRDGRAVFSKEHLVRAYRALCASGRLPFEREVLRRLQMKPMRTHSGVAPVAVMTKPWPCPGRCLFCPTASGLPKSYLPDEPGAMRAIQNHFDPYMQVAGRIASLKRIGHGTDKIELLILGGTWSAYPDDYQEWFIQRCLDAMNAHDSASLAEAQQDNEQAEHRSVGLVIETRPDWVTPDEVRRLRRLGVTKVQLGVQSLDDRILDLNRREHSVEATRQAVRLLRLAGFKLHLHWMPNLLGATPESDLADFRRLWDDPAIRPDELKIYPTALLRNTGLYDYWQRGEYTPYEQQTLIDLIIACKTMTPRYCRLSRVIRDIPGRNIVAGNQESNLRQTVQRELRWRGLRCQCIRCREIGARTASDEVSLEDDRYDAGVAEERFLSFVTADDRLAGFLRLSLPHDRTAGAALFAELEGCAMIREVHVYGPALDIGSDSEGEAQHRGLGRRLIERAEEIARAQGYARLAVIAAIGTRDYYRQRGFASAGAYMVKELGTGE
jgi:elongator complex protein 3